MEVPGAVNQTEAFTVKEESIEGKPQVVPGL